MTIDEAIKEMSKLGWSTAFSLEPAQAQAVRLGIEALKRVRGARDTPAGLSFSLLPGEIAERKKA